MSASGSLQDIPKPQMPVKEAVPVARNEGAPAVPVAPETPRPLTSREIDDLNTVKGAEDLLGVLPPLDSEASSSPELPEFTTMKGRERAYLEANLISDPQTGEVTENWKGLQDRYDSEATGAQHVLGQIEQYAARNGIPPIPENGLQGFDEISRERPGDSAESVVQRQKDYLKALALDQIKAAFHVESITPENDKKLTPEQQKTESVREMSARYIDLAYQAREEGELQDFNPEDLAKLVRENVLKLAYQDYAAAENTLGDHGVRHLVDHNITVTQQLADQLEANGQRVSAADRLMMHQIMIDHDLGYAMDPVRDKINGYHVDEDHPDEIPTQRDRPDLSADRGHNVLAAKFMKERGQMPDDPLARIFTADQIGLMHEGILTHDSSDIVFQIEKPDDSEAVKLEKRRRNTMSAIHLADNTHAFETKLPEVLFATPEGIRTMLLMKIAAESGLGEEAVGEIKDQMREQIAGHTEWSDRYKLSLNRALDTLTTDSYKFAVPRIFGTNPRFRIDQNGKVFVVVDEQPAHRDVLQTFGRDALTQALKFIKDISGKKDLNPNDTSFDSDNLNIHLNVGEQKSTQESEYQQTLLNVLRSQPLQSFLEAYEPIRIQREELAKTPGNEATIAALDKQVALKMRDYLEAERQKAKAT